MKPFFYPFFSYSDAVIKAKIRNLRTQYGKELGKVRASVASGAGTNRVYEPIWRFYDSLHFLRDSITPVKTKPTSGVPEVNVTVVASELASSEVPLAPSGCTNNNDDNECIINDLGELNDEEDETSISRPFDILTVDTVTKRSRRSQKPKCEKRWRILFCKNPRWYWTSSRLNESAPRDLTPMKRLVCTLHIR